MTISASAVPPDRAGGALRRRVRRITAAEPVASWLTRADELRSGPKGMRNHRDDRLVRVVAAASLGPDSCCIDIGANEGLILSILSEIAPLGRHLAFEPVPALASKLEQRFPAVDVRSVALSNERGETSFIVHRELPSRSSIRAVGYRPEETETITVQVDRLDDSLPEGYVPALIKIDVEGAEQLVLEGGRETLLRWHPILLLEHQYQTARHYGSSSRDVWSLLDGAGYRIFDMDGRGPFSCAAFADIVSRGRRWNFLARADR